VTCAAYDLGGQEVRMGGVDVDGDVDDNDRFYVGFSCESAGYREYRTSGNCADGDVAIGIGVGGALVCMSVEPAVHDSFGSRCNVFFGWRDNCNNCTNAPTRWGYTSGVECYAGPSSSCTAHYLDDRFVQLVGVNIGGDADGNDKFYLGMRCE